MKRLVLAVVSLFALVLPAGTAAAHTDTQQGRGKAVETTEVEFTLSSDQCPHLASGTTVHRSGTQTSITTTSMRHEITTIANQTIATGTATADGKTYRFLYVNTYRVSNTVSAPEVFSGIMHDLFLLHGRGPVHLVNGFTAVFTIFPDANPTFEPITQFGDPIVFPAGVAVCDPL